jgi:hypothetical protein
LRAAGVRREGAGIRGTVTNPDAFCTR